MNKDELFSIFEDQNIDRVIEVIRENPELVNLQNEYGQSIFWLACAKNHIELVKIMINSPIIGVLEYDLEDFAGRDALNAAEKLDNKEIVELINPIFGVGVYPESIPESRFSLIMSHVLDVLQRPRSFFGRTFNFSSFGRGGVLASVGALALLISSPQFFIEDNNDRMIAKGEDHIDVIGEVSKRAKKRRNSLIEFQKIMDKENIKNIKVSLQNEIVSEGGKEFITQVCYLEFLKADQKFFGHIKAQGLRNGESLITSDLDQLWTKYKSTKNALKAYAITTCFY